MPDQPKRSVFDPDPPKVKGVPESQREKPSASQDSSDKSTTPASDHEGVRSALRKWLGVGGSDPDFVEGGKGVSKAVDDAVKSAPGNTTEY